MSEIKSVGIVGAGTMGLGIAQVIALAGYKTFLFDVDDGVISQALKSIEKNLDKGIEKGKLDQQQKKDTLERIEVIEDIQLLKADLLIEAIVEKLDAKQHVFSILENVNSETALLASNTSSIPITQIASALKYPERMIGVHFFNPAHIMKLVEIVSGASSDPEVVAKAVSFIKTIGKEPVLAADSPGFIVNRVARHFYVEALQILEEDVAKVEEIDRLMEASGFKMGPFRLMDLIGVDTNLNVTKSMYNAFYKDAKFRPSRIQQQKVDAGHWGKKTGKGFYKY